MVIDLETLEGRLDALVEQAKAGATRVELDELRGMLEQWNSDWWIELSRQIKGDA